MKKHAFLIIILILALVFVTYKWVSTASECKENSTGQSAIENIMSRTSVRAYSDRAVDSTTVDTLLRAAMAAPTAVNKQPWRFIVIDNKEILKYISENFNSMKMAANASVAIVACGDMNAALEGDGRDYWIQDVSAATENLLLAAHAMGLGAVWC
ncbi:MAG: nitroreductase family protein, partial [Muribaculaceae bacterium]|nr:nitroreductase family protein [Muribaculaceae bacterium]